MSDFAVRVVPVSLETHPNADRLSIAKVLGWTCVTGTAGWEDTDRGAYLPIDSVIPEDKIEEWGLVGKLSGGNKNRVKTVRLRGVLSQGLLIPVYRSIEIGTDLTEVWGITKYEPPVPVFMGGGSQHVAKAWPSGLAKYDIERIENFPDLLKVGEQVVATEKLEGTNVAFDLRDGVFSVCSRNTAYSTDEEANQSNLYVKMALQLGVEERLRYAATLVKEAINWDFRSITLRGEIIGPGIQGNIYDLKEHQFRAFDIEVDDRPWSYNSFSMSCPFFGVEPAPVLYRGPFPEDFRAVSYGPSAYNVSRLREGAVWKPVTERSDLAIGRVILKAVDPEYLLKVKD
jgi:RNA ligase (TIGR02306 family)